MIEKYFKSSLYVVTYFTAFFILPEVVFAKDFASGIREAETQLGDILVVLGPVALAVAAGAFHFSRQAGTNLLVSALIGIMLFAAAPTIANLVYNTFR